MITTNDEPVNPMGLTELAKMLSTPERPVYRQTVYMWSKRRDRNGFPNPVRNRDRRGVKYDPAQVKAWFEHYRPSVGGRPRNDA